MIRLVLAASNSSLAAYDREAGTVTIIFQIVGATTEKLNHKEQGEYIQDFVGPLGKATETEGLHRAFLILAQWDSAVNGVPQYLAGKNVGVQYILIVGGEHLDFLFMYTLCSFILFQVYHQSRQYSTLAHRS